MNLLSGSCFEPMFFSIYELVIRLLCIFWDILLALKFEVCMLNSKFHYGFYFLKICADYFSKSVIWKIQATITSIVLNGIYVYIHKCLNCWLLVIVPSSNWEAPAPLSHCPLEFGPYGSRFLFPYHELKCHKFGNSSSLFPSAI